MNYQATIERERPSAMLSCTGCGAEAKAACNCGVAYRPAKERVAEYDKANPGKSTREAAADLGLSKSSVSKARGVHEWTPDKVVGIDGKTYAATRPAAPPNAANQFITAPVEFVQQFIARLDSWLLSEPKLSEDSVTALANALYLCAEEYQRMARHVQQLKGEGENG